MKNAKQLFFILIGLIPLIYLAFIWNTLPEVMPLQFSDTDFKPIRMGSKWDFATGIIIMSFVSVSTYLLLMNIHRIDPKRANAAKSAAFAKLAGGLVLILTSLALVIILGSTHPETKVMELALFPILGLLFMFLGNYMYSVKTNYFVGIRTPWALSDEDNWRKTHQLGGRLFFWSGLIVLICGLAMPSIAGNVMLVLVIGAAIITYGYSYLIFRKSQKAS